MIHPSADIAATAVIGNNCKVWHWAQISADARIGDDCTIGSNVYIDRGVAVGHRVKIQTGAQLYRGVVVEDGVFIGPLACLTNDRYPRAILPDGRLKTDADWEMGRIRVCTGAALGAGSIVLANISVGRFAMVGAGAVAAEDVPDYGLVVGVPARLVGYVCACGQRLRELDADAPGHFVCSGCSSEYVRLAGKELSPSGVRLGAVSPSIT